MKKPCDNRYKLCRESAAFSQEQASERLHISTRTLSDYENGRTNVPEDTVSAMADLYNSPSLIIWHMKNFSPFGKYLPEIQMPQTKGDMAFQLWTAQKDLVPAVQEAMEISRRVLCPESAKELAEAFETITQVRGMLLSATLYAEYLMKNTNEMF